MPGTGSEIDDLRNRVSGTVVTPDASEYESARRVWNWMVDKRPAAVVRCSGEDDVRAALGFARECGFQVAVRGGGHSVAGQSTCDDGIVIDLGGFNQTVVDTERGIATAGGGSLLGDVDRACQAQSMVVPAGVVSHTGAGGLTLGGGVGWLSRKFGLTCDNVASFRVILADGEVVEADEDSYPDLYWGLRGGGGNFGIVTEFRYRCHPFPREIPVGFAYWPIADAPAVLRAHSERMPEQPDEMKATAFVLRASQSSGMPAELVGEPCLMILQVWAGTEMAGAEASFRQLTDVATPAHQRLALMPYLDLQQVDDEMARAGKCNYTKGGYLDEIGEGAIEALVEGAEEALNTESGIEVIPHGGAQLRLGNDDTAFPDRDAFYSFNVYSRWRHGDDNEPYVSWARRSFERIDAHGRGGVYTNFLSPDEGHDRVLAAFGPERYGRLAELKGKYDPDNVFSLNSNIRPAVAER